MKRLSILVMTCVMLLTSCAKEEEVYDPPIDLNNFMEPEDKTPSDILTVDGYKPIVGEGYSGTLLVRPLALHSFVEIAIPKDIIPFTTTTHLVDSIHYATPYSVISFDMITPNTSDADYKEVTSGMVESIKEMHDIYESITTPDDFQYDFQVSGMTWADENGCNIVNLAAFLPSLDCTVILDIQNVNPIPLEMTLDEVYRFISNISMQAGIISLEDVVAYDVNGARLPTSKVLFQQQNYPYFRQSDEELLKLWDKQLLELEAKGYDVSAIEFEKVDVIDYIQYTDHSDI